MLATVFEIAATTFGLIQGILIWLNKKDNSVEYSLKTDSWFPITMAMQLTNVKLIEM